LAALAGNRKLAVRFGTDEFIWINLANIYRWRCRWNNAKIGKATATQFGYENSIVRTKCNERSASNTQEVFLTALTGNGKLTVRIGADEFIWINVANIYRWRCRWNNAKIRQAAATQVGYEYGIVWTKCSERSPSDA